MSRGLGDVYKRQLKKSPSPGSTPSVQCRFAKFTTFDGLYHDAVYAVAIDGTGAKWFGTYGGVSRYTGP